MIPQLPAPPPALYAAPANRQATLATGSTNQPPSELGALLEQQFKESAAGSRDWREDGIEDQDFYDGNQWASEQIRILLDEGRPPIVINQTAKAVNNMLGREAASRFSFLVSPIAGSFRIAAEDMTRGLEYVADQVELDVVTSDVFENAAKGPMGWFGIHFNDHEAGVEPIQVESVHPLNMFWDPHSRKRDLSDCRYLIRVKVVDLDQALGWYPDAATELEARAAVANPWDSETGCQVLVSDDYGNRAGPAYAPGYEGTGWYDSQRRRVALREHWWYVNELADVLALPDGRDVDWDPTSPLVLNLLQTVPGAQRMVKRRRCYHYAICAGDLVVHVDRSPYDVAWRAYPYVPLWCYRSRKGEPYGMVHNMKWPQIELNVARSKFNESVRSLGVIYGKESTTPQERKQIDKAIRRPNFSVAVQDPKAVQFVDNKADSAYWLKIMETSRAEVDEVAGQNEAAYGDPSNEKSGVAIERRVTQQNQNMGRLWDNLRYARKVLGERILGLMMAFWPLEKLRHILAAAAIDENEQPDLTWLDAFDGVENPLGQLKFLVKLQDQDETATERQASMQHRIEMMQLIQDPGLVEELLPDTLRATDWAGAEDMAKKVEDYLQRRAQAAQAPQVPPKPSLNYKDAPEDIRRQMEAADGYHPSRIPPGTPGNPRDLRKEPFGRLPLTDPNGPPQPAAPMPGA